MKRKVYLETTLVSYLTARPSADVIRAARQKMTKRWWDMRRKDFELHVSQLVVDEAAGGDPEAARERLAKLAGVPRLTVSEEAVQLSEELLIQHALPTKAVDDAIHIAVASVHGMDFLLTWNCTHIANAELMDGIRTTISSCGYKCPVICTPEEMLGGLG